MEAIQRAEYVTVGELVRLTGMRYSTLKYYTEEGMLPFVQEEENLTRRYNRTKAVARLLLIRRLKEKGLSIAQIKESLATNQ